MHYLKQLAADGTTDIHPGGARASNRLIETLALSKGLVVLEIGCGPGATLVRIAAAHDVRLIGIDLLPEMLGTALRRIRWSGLHGRVTLLQGDALRLPLADASCDRIYAESVMGIQDASRLDAMLAEIHRTLKPGGRCLLNEAIWRDTTSDAEIEAANESCLSAFGLRQASESPWRAENWNVAMVRAGFRVLSFERMGESPVDGQGSLVALRVRAASRALSLLQRVSNSIRPSARQRTRDYRELLRQHAALGRMIESRLFVIERPR